MRDDGPVSTAEPTWDDRFLAALRRDLRVEAKRGAWAVERADVVAGALVTVLVEVGTGRRYGRTVDLATLRGQFSPDGPDVVSAAWFFTLVPPIGWDESHVHDGVCWYAGQRP